MSSNKVEAGYLSEESDYASSDEDFDWTSEEGGDNNDTDMTDIGEGDEEGDVEEDEEDGEWQYSDMEVEDTEDYLEYSAPEGYDLNQRILRQMQAQSLEFESNGVNLTNLDIEVGSYAAAMAGNVIVLPESLQYYYDMYTGF